MNAPNFTDETAQGVKAKLEIERIIAKLESFGAFLFRLETPNGGRVVIAQNEGGMFRVDIL